MEETLSEKEETLLDYLVRQKFERELAIDEYNKVKATYEAAKAAFESYGDMSIVEDEISKLEKYIGQVKAAPVFVSQNREEETNVLTVVENV